MNTEKLKLEIFTFLWGFAHLAHILRKVSFNDPLAWVFFITCIFVLIKPQSGRLIVMCSTQLVFLFYKMPRTDNHLYIMGFVNLVIVLSLGYQWYKYKSVSVRDLSQAVPAIAAVILISYMAAAIAKFNFSFFDPSVSCAVSMYHDSLRWLPFSMPDWTNTIMPYFIAFTELFIPILLFLNRTRIYGIITVVIFHFMMSFSPTATALDFTIILYALVFLFIPTKTITILSSKYSSIVKEVYTKVDRNILLVMTSILLTFLFITRYGDLIGYRNYLFLIFSVSALALFFMIMVYYSFKNGKYEKIRFVSIKPYLIPVFLVLFINIASPYMGLKTAGTFTMYSNLHISKDSYNHILIPKVPIFSFMDDLVQVQEAEGWHLRRYATPGTYITHVDFLSYAEIRPNQRITFEHNNTTHVDIKASDYISENRYPWYIRKFVQFRAYRPNDKSCSW